MDKRWHSPPTFHSNSPFDATPASQPASPSPGKRLSASGLLTLFKARQSPTSASHMHRSQHISRLRQVHDATSSAREAPPSEEQTVTLDQAAEKLVVVNLDGHADEDDMPSYINVATPTRAEHPTPTRVLPPRSTRAKRNNDEPSPLPSTSKSNSAPRTKRERAAAAAANRIVDSDMVSAHDNQASAPNKSKTKTDTVRNRVREEINTTTKAKRDAFLIHHQDYFLPLLPPSNYVSKLIRAGGDRQSIVTHKQLEEQPPNVTATMKPYQLQGLSFMITMYHNAMPAVLGDEMGLGKTLQTLSLIQYLEETHPTSAEMARPYLVVCPLSVLGSWYDEARKWTPKLKVIRFHGSSSERNNIKSIAQGKIDRFGNDLGRPKGKRSSRNTKTAPANSTDTSFDVMITTYEAFLAEQSWLKQAFIWRYCILDEGHKIKNFQTDIAHALQSLNSEHRLLLTGTPLQNDMRELWSLLHWLYPDVFTEKTSEVFKEAFDLGRGRVDSEFMDNARRLLELVMIRRMKNSPGVNLGLPPKEEVLLYVPLTPVQRFWYTRLLTKADDSLLDELFGDIKQKELTAVVEEVGEDSRLNEVEEAVKADEFTVQSRNIIQQAIANEASGDKETSAYKKLMNLVMQLRKTCIHPYMVKGAAPEPYMLGDHVMHASGKFIVLKKLIDELVSKQGKKILIFSGFTTALDYCEDLLETMGSNQHDAPFHHVRLDGSTARAMRNLQIRLFNDPASETKIMLISTRAGGLGLNLTSASEVIFLDEDWNPQVTVQAEARSHRIGQKNKVTVYKLYTQGTVEEQMMGRIRKKLYLSAKITESMQDIHSTDQLVKRKGSSRHNDLDADGPNLGTSQLMSLIRRGAATLTHPEINVNEMINWDLDTIIEKCKDRPVDPQIGNGKGRADEQEWLARMERVECAVFDGVKYQRQTNVDTALPADLSRVDRRAGKNTTVMVNGFAINKESMGCADWEAVPTFAGKDPRLASPKREKAPPIQHQEDCQVCFDGGEIYLCSRCPRVYHLDCLPELYQGKALSKMNFTCPQHNCIDCERNTTDAGGLIYRCRWCHRGYCEDCLDFGKARLIGGTLPEYEMLSFATKRNAWYVQCHKCVELGENDRGSAKFVATHAKRYEKDYMKYLEQHRMDSNSEDVSVSEFVMPVSRTESMTEATTLDSPGQNTPRLQTVASKGKKRQTDTVIVLSSDEDDTGDQPPDFYEEVEAEAGAQMYNHKRRRIN